MPDEASLAYEPGILRVLQTKSETKAFYDKIAKVSVEIVGAWKPVSA